MDAYLLALALEKAGTEFYSTCIKEVPDPRIKGEFEFLRDEELRHMRYFEQKLQSREKNAETPGPGGITEILGPLEARLAKGAVGSPREALSLGAELEKRAIDFYTGLAEKAEDEETRRDIRKILSEERRHFQKLNLLLE